VLPISANNRPAAWRLVFVDFGMTGTLDRETFSSLREVAISVGTRDAGRLVRAFHSLGVLLPGADLELIERASRRVFQVIWGKSSSDMMKMTGEDAAQFARDFGDLLYEMPFHLPENLILLGRCLGILSGLATGLDEDFNLWRVLAPYALKLVEADEGGVGKRVAAEVGEIVRVLAALPKRVDAVLTRIEDGKMEVRIPELRRYVDRFERLGRKLAGSVIFAAVLIAAALIYSTGQPQIALGFGVADLLVLLWVLLGR